MTLPYIFAGTAITFVIICTIAHLYSKADKKKQQAAAQTAAASYQFSFSPEQRAVLTSALIAKNYNPIIVRVLEYAELGAAFKISTIQRRYNMTFNDAGKTADQMECLGFISSFENNSRRWVVSHDNVQYLLQLINKASPYGR